MILIFSKSAGRSVRTIRYHGGYYSDAPHLNEPGCPHADASRAVVVADKCSLLEVPQVKG